MTVEVYRNHWKDACNAIQSFSRSRSGIKIKTGRYPHFVPIYEFRCSACNHKFSALIGMVADTEPLQCPKCKGGSVSKLVSKFVRGRSEDSRVDEIADQLESMGEPESAAEMREMVKEMGRAMDDDSADEMEEMFEADMEGKIEDEE